MKKMFLMLLSIFIFTSYVIADDVNNIEKNKYKSISKKDWEEYQKYQEEQENNIFISEEEYEKYKQYKEKTSKKEKNEELLEKNEIISNSIFVGIDKTLNYNLNVKINDVNISEHKGDGYGITAEFAHRENGIMVGAGINMNNVDGSTITNFYPYINLVFPLSNKNDETIIDLFFGGAIGYGHYSEKETVNGIDVSGKGTIFYRLSFGININNLVFFMNYSTNHINVKVSSSYYDIKLSGIAKYEKLSIGMGYRFTL